MASGQASDAVTQSNTGVQLGVRPARRRWRRNLLAEFEAYVERRIATLPRRLEDLLVLAGAETLPADAVAVNRAILARLPQDIPAQNSLGPAYQKLGLLAHARAAFKNGRPARPDQRDREEAPG
jgi:hypothetical protein